MDSKTVIILLLLGYMIFWYLNPDKGKDIIDSGIDKPKELIDKAMNGACPTNYDPVCANEQEFNNQCLAMKSGYSNMTLGVCQ